MKTPVSKQRWFFVDETGDPVFYDRRGNLILGQEGVSAILGLGFLETDDPAIIRNEVSKLHSAIKSDAYLQAIPSAINTNRAFHAKDDAPEIRYLVYKMIANLDIKAQFIIARKIEKVFHNTFHSKENEFYDHLISVLFENVLHRFSENIIYFSNRGNKTRQNQLEIAIQSGVDKFRVKWNKEVTTKIKILPQTTVGEPCLQVIDYLNWAVYRAFTRGEMRYFEMIRNKVSLLVDLYDQKNYPDNWYTHKNPFDVKKISPL
jgi:hypothetical protein